MHLGGNLRPDGAGESSIVYYYPGRRRAVVALLSGRNGEAVLNDVIDIVNPNGQFNILSGLHANCQFRTRRSESVFWGAYPGSLVDRFDVHWMFNCVSRA